MSLYVQKFPLSQRISESNRVLAKYPSHVPVVVDCDPKLGTLKKNKFLVPSDVNASHLINSIRNQIKFEKNEAMFIFCGDTLLCNTAMMYDVYSNYMQNKKNGEEQDKFLYLYVGAENTFG